MELKTIIGMALVIFIVGALIFLKMRNKKKEEKKKQPVRVCTGCGT